jgi:hypothetical protein
MNATTAIETLKALLTPGTKVLTQVTGNAKEGTVLVFIKDKNNPFALIPLNMLIEESGLIGSVKQFTERGYKTKTIGMDRGFEFVYKLEKALFGEPQFADGVTERKLVHSHVALGWFLGGESPNKKWLIKSDFEGGQVSAFVVTGTRQDAEEEALWHANEIAGVNGLNREDKSKWVFQDFDALCERLNMEDDEESSFWSGHDCALIYQLSIEEV